MNTDEYYVLQTKIDYWISSGIASMFLGLIMTPLLMVILMILGIDLSIYDGSTVRIIFILFATFNSMIVLWVTSLDAKKVSSQQFQWAIDSGGLDCFTLMSNDPVLKVVEIREL